MKKRNILATCVAITLFGGLPSGVLAQDKEQAASTIFEEVVVTAQRRAQSIYEVPVAISAFTNEALEKQGITNLVDVGKFVPNLNVTSFGAGHTSSANPFIRGIGLQDHLITTDPGVGVYVDGVYLGRQIGQNWSLANIKRMEVLRGPQGTLYGRNSIGRAINIITQVEVGEMQDVSMRVAAKWEPTDRFSLLVVADNNDSDNGLGPYTTLIDELPNGAVFGAGYRNSDLARNKYDNNTGQLDQTEVTNKAYGVSVTAEYEVNDSVSAKLILSDRHSEYRAGLDDDGFVDNFLSFPENGKADQSSAELQFIGEYDNWNFVTGLYYFEEAGDNRQNPVTFNGDGTGNFLLKQDIETVRQSTLISATSSVTACVFLADCVIPKMRKPPISISIVLC